MKLLTFDQHGIVHHLLLPLVAVVVVVGGSLAAVIHANQHTAKANLTISRSSQSKSELANTDSVSKATAAQATDAGSTPTASAASSAKATTSAPSQSKSTTAGTSSTVTTSKSTPAAAPAPSPTPLETLTTIIAGLKTGHEAQVTNDSVEVSGPISTAHARPLVFSVNSQTYYAYTQSNWPNFNTSTTDTANSMAIITVSGSGAASGPAHLDKANNLVDANSAAVGYSTGGGSGR